MPEPMTPSTNPARDEAVRELELIRSLVIPMVRERSREPGDARDQAERVLSALSAAPAPASGVDAAQSLHHESGERITRKDLNDAYLKGAEDGRLATRLIDSMFDGPVTNEASLSPTVTSGSEAGGEVKGWAAVYDGQIKSCHRNRETCVADAEHYQAIHPVYLGPAWRHQED